MDRRTGARTSTAQEEPPHLGIGEQLQFQSLLGVLLHHDDGLVVFALQTSEDLERGFMF